jgi:hypothetical protein
MKRYSDEEIAAIHAALSSPKFNALRMKVTMQGPEQWVSPWEYAALREGEPDAELERDSKRDKRSR